jgi:hypothetical protein
MIVHRIQWIFWFTVVLDPALLLFENASGGAT